jgi:hypothetical protein
MDNKNHFLIIAGNQNVNAQAITGAFQGFEHRELGQGVWLISGVDGTPKEFLAKVRNVFTAQVPTILKLDRTMLQNAVLAPELATYVGVQAAA